MFSFSLIVTSKLTITHLFQCPAHHKKLDLDKTQTIFNVTRTRSQTRQKSPPTSQEFKSKQDIDHLQQHKNWEPDKRQTIFSITITGMDPDTESQLVWVPDTASQELAWDPDTVSQQAGMGLRHSIIRTGIKTDKQSLATTDFRPLFHCPDVVLELVWTTQKALHMIVGTYIDFLTTYGNCLHRNSILSLRSHSSPSPSSYL